jgi:hypothetical protein
MRRSEFAFLILGVALAAYAVFGVMDSAAAPEAAAPVTPLPAVVATTAAPEVEVIEVVEPVAPPPAVEELPSAISDVLGENGHTELLTRSDLHLQLPPSVVAVLIENGAVLRLTDEASPPETAR